MKSFLGIEIPEFNNYSWSGLKRIMFNYGVSLLFMMIVGVLTQVFLGIFEEPNPDKAKVLLSITVGFFGGLSIKYYLAKVLKRVGLWINPKGELTLLAIAGTLAFLESIEFFA